MHLFKWVFSWPTSRFVDIKYECFHFYFIVKAWGLYLPKDFFAGLIFREAYHSRNFHVLIWVGLDNKNSLKQLTLTVHGLIFGRACYRKGFCELDLVGCFGRGLIFG